MSEQTIGGFILGRTIGKGTFNKVKIARHALTNQQAAIKLIDKSKITSQDDRSRLNKQLKILRKTRHPCISQLYQIFEDKQYYYIVTQYASRGQLFSHIVQQQRLTQFEASKYLQQLLSVVQYLHQLGVVHRDLKPQNILLDYKFNIKIIDFGLSNIYPRGGTLKTPCGSPCYAAPEMLLDNHYDPLKTDMWSVGVILYAMCFGYLPFDHSQPAQLYRMIRQGTYQVPQHASAQLRDILSRILQVQPRKRATIQQVRTHPFCRFARTVSISGIIPGLSVIPYQQSIQKRLIQMNVNVNSLHFQILNNKHTPLTAAYYLLLQQELRNKSQSMLSYYNRLDAFVNRYRIIQRIKESYDLRIIKMKNSRKDNKEKGKESRKTTSKKKYHTGVDYSSGMPSKSIFSSPPTKKKQRLSQSTKRKQSLPSKLKRK